MEKQPLHDIISPSGTPRRNPTSAGIRRPQPQTRRVEKRRKNSSNLSIWISIIVLLVILALAFSFLFSGATVTVTPKQQDVFIDGVFSTGDDLLKFNVMKVEETLSDTVKATEKEYVEERASGTIVVYNNYNSAQHNWIKNTRFETPEGLIFKVRKSMTIPGRETVDGKVVPGSVEITVTADEPGVEYNIGLTDFVIPVFKGKMQYEEKKESS